MKHARCAPGDGVAMIDASIPPEMIAQKPAGTGEPSAAKDELAPPAAAIPPVARVVARRPCQVVFSRMLASEQARAEVHAWVERLGELTSHLMVGQVLVEAVDQGNKERHYRVRMELTLPTGVVAVDYDHPNNRPHEDICVAIRNAFRAARRQLEAHRHTAGPP